MTAGLGYAERWSWLSGSSPDPRLPQRRVLLSLPLQSVGHDPRRKTRGEWEDAMRLGALTIAAHVLSKRPVASTFAVWRMPLLCY